MVRMAEPAMRNGEMALESALFEITGSRHALAFCGRDAALAAALAAIGAEGGEVIASPLGEHASAVQAVGAVPALADIDRASGSLNPSALESALSPRQRAVLAAHVYGQPCDIDAITVVARRHGLAVIEECSSALGAVYKGRAAGSLAPIAVCRVGNASVLFTSDATVAWRAAERARECGLTDREVEELRCELAKLERENAGRRTAAATYNRLLSGVAGVITPIIRRDVLAVYSQYVVRVADAWRARERLSEAGIDAPPLPAVGGRGSGCPNAEEAARCSLALPLYPGIAHELQAEVVRLLATPR